MDEARKTCRRRFGKEKPEQHRNVTGDQEPPWRSAKGHSHRPGSESARRGAGSRGGGTNATHTPAPAFIGTPGSRQGTQHHGRRRRRLGAGKRGPPPHLLVGARARRRGGPARRVGQPPPQDLGRDLRAGAGPGGGRRGRRARRRRAPRAPAGPPGLPVRPGPPLRPGRGRDRRRGRAGVRAGLRLVGGAAAADVAAVRGPAVLGRGDGGGDLPHRLHPRVLRRVRRRVPPGGARGRRARPGPRRGHVRGRLHCRVPPPPALHAELPDVRRVPDELRRPPGACGPAPAASGTPAG